MTTPAIQNVQSELLRMQDLRREIGKAGTGACNCKSGGGPLRENHSYACRYRALDAAMEFVDEQITRLRAQGAALNDDDCDRIATQAMDEVAATKNMHALDLNPDVSTHHALRRALVRAGAKHASTPTIVYGADMSAVISAAEKVVLDAIDNRRDEVHVCDRNNNDLAVRACSQEVQDLHAALKALRAPASQAEATGAAAVQWRNIRKTVGELAKFCFGGPEERGSVTLGAAYISLVSALTAKDGLQVHLEPLPAADADLVIQAKIAERYKDGLEQIMAYRGKGDCSTDVIDIAESTLSAVSSEEGGKEGAPSNA